MGGLFSYTFKRDRVGKTMAISCYAQFIPEAQCMRQIQSGGYSAPQDALRSDQITQGDLSSPFLQIFL